jgi:hypothetical protein
MSEDLQDQTLRCRWLLRIRRSFGVPDLLNDDHAKAAIVGRLLVKHPMNAFPIGGDEVIVGKLVEALIDDYAAGAMDSSILADAEPTWFDDQTSLDSAFARAFSDPSGRPTEGTIAAVEAMRESFVSTVRRSVEEFPFEDCHGGYFGHHTD